MEKIFTTLIICFFTNIIFFNFFKVLENFLKILENKNKNEENNFITFEEYENICQELTMLKSKHLKNYRAIKNIIKRLPFKGEDWEQEFVREELEELEKSGYYTEVENIMKETEELKYKEYDKMLNEIYEANKH